MTKKVDFSVRPKARPTPLPANSDEWVSRGSGEKVAMTKLSLYIPTSLHRAFKTRCVQEGVTMRDKVRTMIEAQVAETGSAAGTGKQGE